MRDVWVKALLDICGPVLEAASEDRLRDSMLDYDGCSQQKCLEAVGRIICGIGPWLNLPDDESAEGFARNSCRSMAVQAITNLLDTTAGDYLDFGANRQSLVDGAYLAHGLLRSPQLLRGLLPATRKKLILELVKTRRIIPPNTNWLLFASIIEAFLLDIGEPVDQNRLKSGVRKFVRYFYVGDGVYGDGAQFHHDYYNSFVIHPMLFDTLTVMTQHGVPGADALMARHLPRFRRFTEVQERSISPEGAWPVVGRTLVCRFGAFHALSHAAFKEQLSMSLVPAQVRCALHAVLLRSLSSESNLGKKGFLTIGFNGCQRDIAEDYVSSGSPYHCATFFVSLGLSSTSPFWADSDSEWTSLKAFSGHQFPVDVAYDENESFREIVERLIWIFVQRVKNKSFSWWLR
ncbi:DUF2264 domain-containing protein [Zhongshania sp.]|jgi:hypothetical protein|uniref:DUF2264 domain-containing protein n=1 Tax=Zhongshania sp. TaxID=1971902 RepID=UPI0039E709BA